MQEPFQVNDGLFIKPVSFCVSHLHVPGGHLKVSGIPVQMIDNVFCHRSVLVVEGKVSDQVSKQVIVPGIPVLLPDIFNGFQAGCCQQGKMLGQ